MGIYARFVARMERQARLMDGMMERLNVDSGEIARHSMGLGLERAARACVACATPEACEKWQAETEGKAVEHAPSFSPNASLFENYRAQ